MDLAGAGIALIVGADEIVLRLRIGAAGAEIQLCPAICTIDKPRENAGLAELGQTPFVGTKFLYPFPLPRLNDGWQCVLKNTPVFGGILHPLLELERFPLPKFLVFLQVH